MIFSRRAIVLVAILGLAIVLRATELDAPFWCDESFTALTATAERPIDSLLTIEHSPPLYYIGLMPIWARGGESEAWFRIPSVIFGCGIVLLSIFAGTKLDGPRAGIIAGILAATNAYLVIHSREARSYMTAGFFSYWMLIEAIIIIRDDKTRNWIGFGIAALLACYTHYVQVFLAASAGLMLIAMLPRKRTFAALSIITLAGIIAFLPWFAYLRTQLFQNTFYAGVWKGEGFSSWNIRDGIYYPIRLIAWSWIYNIPSDIYHKFYNATLLLIAGIGAGIFLRRPLPRERIAMIVLMAIVLAVAGALWALRIVGEPVYILALFALMVLYVALVLDDSFARGGFVRIISVAVAFLFALSGYAGIHEARENRFHLEGRLTREPWPTAVAQIAQRAEPGDGVVVIPGWPSAGGWYFRESELPLYQIWDPTPYFARVAPYEKLFVGEPDSTAAAIAAKHRRVFTLRSFPGHYKRESEFWAGLGGEKSIVRIEKYGALDLGILDISNAQTSDTSKL